MVESKWPLMKNNINWSDKWKMLKFIATTNQYTQGPKVKAFEHKWNEWLGSNHSLFVSSGSTANFLLIASCMEKYNIKPGSKVVLPACTWMTNVAPVIQLGLTPVFCDINLVNYSYDLSSLRQIAKTNDDIRMVFVSHLLGFNGNSEEVKLIFPNAIIIDDVCESHGCTDYNGNKTGSNSIGSTFSFYFGHHMTSIEGGMISTRDYELFDIMRMKRSHGMARHSAFHSVYEMKHPDIDPAFMFVTDGYNFRNNEISAVLGMNQLERLDKFISIRRNNYSQFVKIINQFQTLFDSQIEDKTNSSFCLPIICKSNRIKQELITKLRANGIEYRPIVSGNLLKQPFLSAYSELSMPNAQKLHECGLYIGNNQFVNHNDLKLLTTVFEDMMNDRIYLC